ncbi:MAG: hypothetical protein RQ758_05470 [Methanomicrobiaceae archaeon]|nr:hypothetical protein [Methanomicrobiaceae archaeon]
MKRDTRDYLMDHTAVIIFSALIIVLVAGAPALGLSLSDLRYVILLIAFLILGQIFSRALAHEPEKTKRRVQYVILALVLLLLGAIVISTLLSTGLLVIE